MKRGIILAGILGLLGVLVAADPAQAQWFGRGRVFVGPYGGYYGGYYYGPYYRTYYAPYYYPPPTTVYYSQPVVRESYYAAPANAAPGYAAPASTAPAGSAVTLHIKVPRADARVWIEGQQMQLTGTDRDFQSPPLDAGRGYTYTIRAAWMQGGDEVSREQKLDVKAGQDVVVDFRKPRSDTAPAPRPLPSGTRAEKYNNAEETSEPPPPPKQPLPTEIRPQSQEQPQGALESPPPDNRTAADKTHEGKVVKAGDGKLTMTDKDGNNRHMHDVSASALITRDGKDSKLADLKEGDFVKVTTETDSKGKSQAVKIEARTREE
jgi:uncharacterized protein (TIGR03000 family)